MEPLWALFGGVIFYFAPLYMKELGLTDIEMGLVNSAGFLFSFFYFIMAGPLTNKFGRRITSLVWDIVSWSTSMLIWAFARNFAWFLVAVLFNSAVRVVMVSWNMLLTEDAREDQRARIYSIINITGTLGGFVTLAAGLLLQSYGVIPVMRITYLLGAVFMTAMFIIRFFLTTETANGIVILEKTRSIPLSRLVAQQMTNLVHAARDRHFFMLTLVFLIATAVQSFTFFQILFLKDNLGYSTAQLSIVPAVNSLLTIFLFAFVFPRIPKKAERIGLLVGFVICGCGGLAFLFLGRGMLPVVLFVQGLSAAAFLLLGAYRDSVFMNSVPNDQKAELFGLVNMMAMLLSIPTGALAGWLFSLSPHAPFVAVVTLFAAGAAATLRLIGSHRKGQAGG
jgi:Na+/melibiose symporter-like transporter